MVVGLWIAFWGGIITWTMIGEVYKWVGAALIVVGLTIAGIAEKRIMKRIEKWEEMDGR